MIINTLIIILCLLGLVLFVGGSVGILRLPDVYTRLHMAGKLDTLGTLSLLLGLGVYFWTSESTNILVVLKMLLLWGFVSFTSPTATHAMVDAGMRAGLNPWMKPDKKRKRS
jgi:multicomponent Na+:H+ antiporter subunit G